MFLKIFLQRNFLKRFRKDLFKKRQNDIKANEPKTIFIGNVPLSIKSPEIKRIFKEFGSIEAIYQRSLIQKNQKLTLKMLSTNKKLHKTMSSKIMFLRFKSEESAQAAAAKM